MRSMVPDAAPTESELQCLRSTLPMVGSGRIFTRFADPSFDELAPLIREQPLGRGIIFIESDIGRAWYYLAKQRGLPVAMYRRGMSGWAEAAAFREFKENPRCVLLANASALIHHKFPDIKWAMHYDPPACIEDWVSDTNRIGRYGATTYLTIRTSDEAWAERRRQIDKRLCVRFSPVQDVWREAAYQRLESLRQLVTEPPISEIPSRIDQHFAKLIPDCVATQVALAVRIGGTCGWAARPVRGQTQSGLVDPQELAALVDRISPALVCYCNGRGQQDRQVAKTLAAICEERGVKCFRWPERKLSRVSDHDIDSSYSDESTNLQNRQCVGRAAVAVNEARWLVLPAVQSLIPQWAIADYGWASHAEDLFRFAAKNPVQAASSVKVKPRRKKGKASMSQEQSNVARRRSMKGSAIYRNLAAQTTTLIAHLDQLAQARDQIDALDNEALRREAIVVVRDAIENFQLAKRAIDLAICESRNHFGL